MIRKSTTVFIFILFFSWACGNKATDKEKTRFDDRYTIIVDSDQEDFEIYFGFSPGFSHFKQPYLLLHEIDTFHIKLDRLEEVYIGNTNHALQTFYVSPGDTVILTINKFDLDIRHRSLLDSSFYRILDDPRKPGNEFIKKHGGEKVFAQFDSLYYHTHKKPPFPPPSGASNDYFRTVHSQRSLSKDREKFEKDHIVEEYTMNYIDLLNFYKEVNKVNDSSLIYNFLFDKMKHLMFRDLTLIYRFINPHSQIKEALTGHDFSENYIVDSRYTEEYINDLMTKLYRVVSTRGIFRLNQWKNGYKQLNEHFEEPLLRAVKLFVYKNLGNDGISTEELEQMILDYEETYNDTINTAYIKQRFLYHTFDDRKEKYNGEPYLVDLSNKTIAYDQYIKSKQGKWLFVSFWSSYCIPCREAIPSTLYALNQLKDEDIEFAFFSVDHDMYAWERACEKENIEEIADNYTIKNFRDSDLYKNIGYRTISHYLVYDKEGNLVNKNAMSPKNKDFLAFLKSYL